MHLRNEIKVVNINLRSKDRYSVYCCCPAYLKGLAQAKIIKKSVILFRVLNMTIWCKHVQRLELKFVIIFVLRIHQLG